MTHVEVGAACDKRAAEYEGLFGSVAQSPSADRELIARWRDATPGLLLDAGCGPAHWACFLDDSRHQVLALDTAEQFLARAHQRFPTVGLVRASMEALPVWPESVDGILAWYSIIHTPPALLPTVVAEFTRVLKVGGTLLLGFVDGPAATPFPHAVLTAYHWSVEELEELLVAAGLLVLERHQRHDHGSRPHAALLARKGPLGWPDVLARR